MLKDVADSQPQSGEGIQHIQLPSTAWAFMCALEEKRAPEFSLQDAFSAGDSCWTCDVLPRAYIQLKGFCSELPRAATPNTPLPVLGWKKCAGEVAGVAGWVEAKGCKTLLSRMAAQGGMLEWDFSLLVDCCGVCSQLMQAKCKICQGCLCAVLAATNPQCIEVHCPWPFPSPS